jgi:hypothetical protein
MYTVIERRKNTDRMQEIAARAQQEFFPKLQSAVGFTGFYLVNDESDNTTTAILVFENKARFDGFAEQVGNAWLRTLDEYGHTRTGFNQGETVVSIAPRS